MAKKPRMGRGLGALMQGPSATRNVVPAEEIPVAEAPEARIPPPRAEALPGEDTAQAPAMPSAGADRGSTGTSAPGSDAGAAAGATTSAVADAAATESGSVGGDKLRMLGIDQISRGAYQPRQHFDAELLQELADSLKAQGLIQPILVRPSGTGYELIAGERRWRAAQLAGFTEIPAIIRSLDDQSVASVSLIENIQRKDLNPLEEARALQRLCEEFGMTHKAVAESVGRSRVAVTNLMRLLDLHAEVRELVDAGTLEMGHARALLGAPLDEQPAIARRIIKQGLTVRAVEKIVRDLREGGSAESERDNARALVTDPDIDSLRRELGDKLGAPVLFKHRKNGSGTVEISYSSLDELEGILGHIR